MNELVDSQTSAPQVSEAVPLAQELAKAHSRLVGQLRSQYGLDTPEAAQRAEQLSNADTAERHLAGPIETLSWLGLDAIARHDPARAAAAWEQIKAEARAELTTGHRAAQAVATGEDNCLTRARFLAIREELTNDWRPASGQERLLIDTMAQALTAQEHWLRRMMVLDALENEADEPSDHKSPRLPMAAAIEQAANMADRFNRIFTRVLRQLRDLRRYTPQIVVRHAELVAVGKTD